MMGLADQRCSKQKINDEELDHAQECFKEDLERGQIKLLFEIYLSSVCINLAT